MQRWLSMGRDLRQEIDCDVEGPGPATQCPHARIDLGRVAFLHDLASVNRPEKHHGIVFREEPRVALPRPVAGRSTHDFIHDRTGDAARNVDRFVEDRGPLLCGRAVGNAPGGRHARGDPCSRSDRHTYDCQAVRSRHTDRPSARCIHSLPGRGSKEHFVAIGLALLPAYWICWQKKYADEATQAPAAALTLILAFIVWWSFLIGHVLNNIMGFGL